MTAQRSDEGTAENSTAPDDSIDDLETSEQKLATARPAIFINDDPLILEGYPDEVGDLRIMTAPSGDVILNSRAETEDTSAEVGIRVDPDTADELAALFEDFAVKARTGVRANKQVPHPDNE